MALPVSVEKLQYFSKNVCIPVPWPVRLFDSQVLEISRDNLYVYIDIYTYIWKHLIRKSKDYVYGIWV